MRPEDFFAGHPDAGAVFEKVRSVLLEIRDAGDIDDEVVGWLHEAADRAS